MTYLLTTEQSKLIDDFAINELGLPSIILMEDAARSCAEIIKSKIRHSDKIAIICGVGNNGGDGFAVARHLSNFGFFNIQIFIIGDINKMSFDTNINYQSLKKMGLSTQSLSKQADLLPLNFNFDVIIEAMIGTGGNEDLREFTVEILKSLNASEALKIAIDVPAGLNSSTGKCHIDAFKANITISIFSPKVGSFINEGVLVSGKVITAYLGVNKDLARKFSNHYILDNSDIAAIVPKRKPISSKFDYGKILIIAGSKKFPGAAALSANASIKSGAGLVYLASTIFHHSLVPEIIPVNCSATADGGISINNYLELSDYLNKSDVIAIGSGIGSNSSTLNLVEKIIENFPAKKIILDADALKVIDKNSKLNTNFILTPHLFEFKNMFKISADDLKENLLDLVVHYAKKLNCTILLKHYPTIISNGDFTYFNTGGNAGMATAGCGDVLTGIISTYSYQIDNSLLSAAVGAFIHSYLGDIYAQKYNQSSLVASDLINSMKDLRFV